MKNLKEEVISLISKQLKADAPNVELLDILNRLLGCCIQAEINKIS